MDLQLALQVLQSAHGDDASLSLAAVDLCFPDLLEEERAKLCAALEMAAVPHWFDEKILAA
ncbi:MAG: hypothetical protein ACREXU_10645 [Gammaproteobacteria bacterium]